MNIKGQYEATYDPSSLAYLTVLTCQTANRKLEIE